MLFRKYGLKVFALALVLALSFGCLTACEDFEDILNSLIPPEEPFVPGPDVGSDPIPVSGSLKVHFIDVGQADCVLVETSGSYMLIDTGDTDNDYTEKIINYLDNVGVETLDYLILTHPDADHIGGAPEIINEYKIGHCIMPDFTKTTKIFESTIDALEENQVDVIEAVPGFEFIAGEADCRILAPLNEYDDANDASVVIKMIFGSTSFLLTGDAEKESEADIVEYYSAEQLKSTVMKSGHHGSRTSSSEALLEAVDPDFIVISCGEDNKYGHPHEETIDRYEEMGIPYYRTDISGTVIVSSDGENVSVTCEKQS